MMPLGDTGLNTTETCTCLQATWDDATAGHMHNHVN